MANYNSNLHPENDTGSVVFPNINGQSIPENAITPSKVAAGQFPQIVAGSVQNPLTIVTAAGQTEYDGSGAATIDISSIQTADHAYTADRATADADGNNIPATYAKQDGSYPTLTSGQAQVLTESLNVGNSSSSSIQGYYQFLTLAQLGNYQQANIRLEFSDVNITNSEESPCGIELQCYNSTSSPNRVDVKVLYGKPGILNNVWASVTSNNGVSLYFYNRGAYTAIRVKALYQGARNAGDAFEIFENTSNYISELPSANTNTALPDLPYYSLITQAASAISDENGLNIADNYALQDGDYETLGAGYLSKGEAIVTAGTGWHKLVQVTSADLDVITSERAYSCIIDIQGINPAGNVNNDADSSRIEIDTTVSTNGFNAQNTAIKILSGNVDPNSLCAVIQPDNTLTVYCYFGTLNRSYYTIVSEVYVTSHVNAMTFIVDNTPIASAPSGAVYAVIRNEASGAQYLSREMSFNNNTVLGWANVGAFTIQSGDVNHQYSCIFLVNGTQHIQGADRAEPSGLLELDFDGSSTAALTVFAGNLNPHDYCVVVTDTEVILYHNMAGTYNTTQFVINAEKQYGKTVVESMRFAFADNVTYGQANPTGAVYATVRNGADHLVLSDAVGSTTTPVYFSADGVPQPCTLPVSTFYTHTFVYNQPSGTPENSQTFIFSVVLSTDTPIPSNDPISFSIFLGLPQTSTGQMPTDGKILPANGILKIGSTYYRILGIILAAAVLGTSIYAKFIYDDANTVAVYPSNSNVVTLDMSRMTESSVTP